MAPIDNLPSVFTHADAMANGISNRLLHEMRVAGEIERLARGIYVRPGLQADPDLVEISMRSTSATLCLTSALAHHELTDEIPPRINVALPRSHRPPKTTAPVTWHRFDDGTFHVGRDQLTVLDDLTVGIYDPVRTIVDAYRLRHLYGTDQALHALKQWLRTRGNQPAELLAMTKHFPSTTAVIRSTLETLL